MSSKRCKKAGNRRRRQSDKGMVGLTRSSPSSTEPSQIKEEERLEQRRRLDGIVKDYLDDSGVVYDRPDAQDIMRRHQGAWLMSGALISNPSQISQGIRPRKSEELSSSALTNPTTPAFRTMRIQRQPMASPGPLQFAGPQPQQFSDRFMPRILPTFAPTTSNPSGLTSGSSKRTKAAKGTGYTQGGKLSTPKYHSGQSRSETPIPAPEP
ncbi:hypothetical protein F5Y13DRAFT_190192 [Hypoxylon sp. FL1857]|nr:hypothetical protein F5Y13DRAFT_190192 [Hypoxylon sp. FL1857]